MWKNMSIILRNKELDVMQILWSSDTDLSVTDFTERNKSLVTSTVQAALRSLLKKSYIEVADIVQHNKVFARTYRPVLTENEYMMDKFKASSIDKSMFVAALVQQEKNFEVLEELEALISEQKDKLEKGNK